MLYADPEWAAHMDRAFRSPRYDSYFTRHWQLVREAWNRNASLSPSLVFVSLWAHSLPDWFSVKSYADILVQKAHEASGAGHPEQAQSLLQEVDSLGRRMTNQSETDSERLLGLDLSRRATMELRDLYEGGGKKSETWKLRKICDKLRSAGSGSCIRSGASKNLGYAHWNGAVSACRFPRFWRCSSQCSSQSA